MSNTQQNAIGQGVKQIIYLNVKSEGNIGAVIAGEGSIGEFGAWQPSQKQVACSLLSMMIRLVGVN